MSIKPPWILSAVQKDNSWNDAHDPAVSPGDCLSNSRLFLCSVRYSDSESQKQNCRSIIKTHLKLSLIVLNVQLFMLTQFSNSS